MGPRHDPCCSHQRERSFRLVPVQGAGRRWVGRAGCLLTGVHHAWRQAQSWWPGRCLLGWQLPWQLPL